MVSAVYTIFFEIFPRSRQGMIHFQEGNIMSETFPHLFGFHFFSGVEIFHHLWDSVSGALVA